MNLSALLETERLDQLNIQVRTRSTAWGLILRYVRSSLRPNKHQVLLPLQDNKFRSYLLGAGSPRGPWIDLGS